MGPVVLSSYEKALETARKQREDAERRERERIAQAEADRASRLFAQVAARQQAQQIRHYVDEVEATPGAMAGRAFEGDRDAWAAWALALAARLDPLLPGDDSGLTQFIDPPSRPNEAKRSDSASL